MLQRQDEEVVRYSAARAAGDFDTAAIIAGEVVDLITDIPLAAEIVERMVTAATRLLAGASNKYRISHGGSEPRGEWDALYYSGFVGLAPHCRHLTVWGTDFRPAWRSASSSIWASVARYAAAFLSAAVRR